MVNVSMRSGTPWGQEPKSFSSRCLYDGLDGYINNQTDVPQVPQPEAWNIIPPNHTGQCWGWGWRIYIGTATFLLQNMGPVGNDYLTCLLISVFVRKFLFAPEFFPTANALKFSQYNYQPHLSPINVVSNLYEPLSILDAGIVLPVSQRLPSRVRWKETCPTHRFISLTSLLKVQFFSLCFVFLFFYVL